MERLDAEVPRNHLDMRHRLDKASAGAWRLAEVVESDGARWLALPS